MRRLLFVILLIILSSNSFGQISKEARDPRREKLIGNILKNALETYHYRGMVINDEVSQKAFAQYLKKVDPSKQFFTKSDVKELEPFQFKMDDEMLTGDYTLLERAIAILKKRVAAAENIRKEIFKTQFDFSNNDSVQVDPEKREWPADENQWKENLRLTFKQATLNKYLSLIDEQSDNPRHKNKMGATKPIKKAKNEKKLTDAEMRAKAHEVTSSRFQKIFSRYAKTDRDDQLDNFYNAITAIYDPHTNYMPAKKKQDFDTDITGQLEGIGAVLGIKKNQLTIISPLEGTPAKQAGLKAGDIIVKINGERVSDTENGLSDIIQKSKAGDKVDIEIWRGDETIYVETTLVEYTQ